jgi:hypothetical protein
MAHRACCPRRKETAMYVKPRFTRPSSAWTAVAAALAAVAAIGMLTLVVELFSSRGMPLQELAVAERACSTNPHVSERESCMRDWLAAKRGHNVAGEAASR